GTRLARLRTAPGAPNPWDLGSRTRRRSLLGPVAPSPAVDSRGASHPTAVVASAHRRTGEVGNLRVGFQRTGGSVLIAAILHGATNPFTLSPAGSTAHELELPIP